MSDYNNNNNNNNKKKKKKKKNLYWSHPLKRFFRNQLQYKKEKKILCTYKYKELKCIYKLVTIDLCVLKLKYPSTLEIHQGHVSLISFLLKPAIESLLMLHSGRLFQIQAAQKAEMIVARWLS